MKYKKPSQKTCKSPKNCSAVDIARDRSKTLTRRERKTKTQKNLNSSFFTFTFLYRKIHKLIFVRKHI